VLKILSRKQLVYSGSTEYNGNGQKQIQSAAVDREFEDYIELLKKAYVKQNFSNNEKIKQIVTNLLFKTFQW